MKIEQQLHKYKNSYQAIRSPENESIERDWQDISLLLTPRKKASYTPTYAPFFAFAGMVILFGAGVIAFAQTTNPGDTLYPVKSFSQQALEKISGKQAVNDVDIQQTVIEKPYLVTPTTNPTPTLGATAVPTQLPQIEGVSDRVKQELSLPNGKALPAQSGKNPSSENKAAVEEKKAETPGNEKKSENPSEEKANQGKSSEKNPNK